MTQAAADPSAVPASTVNLVELGAGIAKQVADLGSEGSPTDAESLRTRFEDLFRSFEQRAVRAGYTESEVSTAKYALAAVVDETILLSELPAKDEWLGRPLQMTFFDDFSAGEGFYDKLDQARTVRSPRGPDVLEVFHICLALGFRGKYGDARGAERRRVLMDALAAEINQARGVTADAPLSPAGLPPEAMVVGQRGLRFLGGGPLWLVPLITVVVLLLLLIAFGVHNDTSLSAIPGDEPAAGAKP